MQNVTHIFTLSQQKKKKWRDVRVDLEEEDQGI